jgi:ABC-type transport system involved in resistance to organic solvents, periplasmic component
MKIHKETKIGLIIVAIIAFFIWGFNFLKGRNLFTTHQQYYAVFTNVANLQKSSVVSTNGYKVGTVSDISFIPGNVNKIVVEISVDRQFKLPKNTIVEIFSSDLMGSKAVNLVLGDSRDFVKQYDTLQSRVADDLSNLISKQVMPLKEKAENLIVSIDSVMKIVHHTLTPQTQQSIQHSILALESLIVTEKQKVDEIMANLASITGNLKNSNSSITRITKNLSTISDSIAASNLKKAIDQAAAVMAQTNQMLTDVNAGKGSLGKLAKNDSLYNALNRSIVDLDALLVDLKEHPKRYVHFSVFGKKDSKPTK